MEVLSVSKKNCEINGKLFNKNFVKLNLFKFFEKLLKFEFNSLNSC
jgi:hypothetical protein